jgi:serine/threonine-protein kinase
MPRATLSVNATPWAQVWLDGESVGDTPIGNLTTTVGSHELIFRHPQLGEKRVTTLVTLKEPARVAIDMQGGK